METIVVVAQHKNKHYGRGAYTPARFGSSPSGHFREINCRTFQSEPVILPTPFIDPCATHVTIDSSKTSSPTLKAHVLKSSPIAINIPSRNAHFNDELGSSSENSLFSELWAGPAYSNSPPPSSLPIPKFSMRPKRTVSLDFPHSDSGIKMAPFAKSAPASPTREYGTSTRDLFHSIDSATKTLRRILNLDAADEEI